MRGIDGLHQPAWEIAWTRETCGIGILVGSISFEILRPFILGPRVDDNEPGGDPIQWARSMMDEREEGEGKRERGKERGRERERERERKRERGREREKKRERERGRGEGVG